MLQDPFFGGEGVGGGVQALVQKGLLNFFVANYCTPHPLPPVAVAHYNFNDDFI